MALNKIQQVSPSPDQILNENEEQEILQAAARQGLGSEAVQAALAQVCTSKEVIVESQVRERLRQVIEVFAEAGGFTKKEFAAAVALCRKELQGRGDEAQCRRMVAEIITANDYPVRQGFFDRWYEKVKKECAAG